MLGTTLISCILNKTLLVGRCVSKFRCEGIFITEVNDVTTSKRLVKVRSTFKPIHTRVEFNIYVEYISNVNSVKRDEIQTDRVPRKKLTPRNGNLSPLLIFIDFL